MGTALRPTREKFRPSRSKVCAIGRKVGAIGRKVRAIHQKFTEAHTNARQRHCYRREGRARPAKIHHASSNQHLGGAAMNTKLTWILQWARRLRDFLVAYEPKSDVADVSVLRKELDDAIAQLTASAAAQEAITKQSRVQTMEIRRLRSALREGNMKPIVRMSRTMKLVINDTEVTFVFPDPNIDSERLAAAGDAMVTALNVLGPQFVARGFAANFVEQLSNAVKALRDAIDQRSAQLARRIGTTASMQQHGDRAIQLVRVIDTLVRP